jgi:hypothetical protein
MAASKWLAGMGTVVLAAALVAGQQQQSATQPAPRRQTRSRLTRPWSQIKDLTDDEKTKILEFHRKGLDERAASLAKEREEIFALLTDEQKKEVAAIEAQPPQRATSRRGSTTRPAGQ